MSVHAAGLVEVEDIDLAGPAALVGILDAVVDHDRLCTDVRGMAADAGREVHRVALRRAGGIEAAGGGSRGGHLEQSAVRQPERLPPADEGLPVHRVADGPPVGADGVLAELPAVPERLGPEGRARYRLLDRGSHADAELRP